MDDNRIKEFIQYRNKSYVQHFKEKNIIFWFNYGKLLQ